MGTWTKDPSLWSWTGSHGPKTGTKVSKESGQKIGFVLVFVSFIHCIDVQKIFICKCRGVSNHNRVAEGTRLSPEGEYSGVS